MSWIPVLLALLAHCIGGGSQPVLNQPPSMSSSLGTTIHLPCTLSRDHDVSVYNIFWYQQKPGQPPRFLLRYFSHLDNHQETLQVSLIDGITGDLPGSPGVLNWDGIFPQVITLHLDIFSSLVTMFITDLYGIDLGLQHPWGVRWHIHIRLLSLPGITTQWLLTGNISGVFGLLDFNGICFEVIAFLLGLIPVFLVKFLLRENSGLFTNIENK